MKKKMKLLFMTLSIFMILIVCYSRYIEPERLVVKEITVETEMNIENIVIFGGDLFDNYARDKELLDMKYLQEELSRIEAKAGKYAVFGNHDYGGGAFRIYETFMNDCEFQVLDDKRLL